MPKGQGPPADILSRSLSHVQSRQPLQSRILQPRARDVKFAQKLVGQAWGGTDFHVRDPDGNVVSFVQYRAATAP